MIAPAPQLSDGNSLPAGAAYRIRWTARQRIARWASAPWRWLQGRLIRRFLQLNAAGVAFWIAQLPIVFSIVATLVRLKVFDRLRPRPMTAAELAHACGADQAALLRLLRTAAVLGVLHRDRQDRFSLSPVGRQFLSDSPNPVAAWTELMDRLVVTDLPRMSEAVMHGDSLTKIVHAKTCWEIMGDHPGTTELHDIACGGWTRLVVDAVANAYDFSSARTVIDVGGGRGAFLSAVLKAAPHLEGRVYDRATTRQAAEAMFAEQGVAARAAHVTGDFFQSVPAGADVYTIKHVLHDWDDERALRILRNIRGAIPRQGRLLIVEGSTDHGLLPSGAILAVWDVTQFAVTWGKSRTLPEFADLVRAAGFELSNVWVPRALDSLILECVPNADWVETGEGDDSEAAGLRPTWSIGGQGENASGRRSSAELTMEGDAEPTPLFVE